MANKEPSKLDKILQGIEDTAKKHKINPQEVTKAQFLAKLPKGITHWDLRTLGGLTAILKEYFPPMEEEQEQKEVKILIFDIETAPLLAYTWGTFDQDIALNQIKDDWCILSWSAKWLNDPATKIMYQDQRGAKDVRDDKAILQSIWDLLNEADVVITQNGKSFDVKKLNTRFILHGFPPPSSYRHIDTKILAKKNFAFTSNRLEYMTDKLCTKYKKLKHAKFPGFALWTACLNGDQEAWKEMEKYNKHDVLSLEELYTKLAAWDHTVNFDVFQNENQHVCSCGSTEFKKNGYAYTSGGKYQRYSCSHCGKESRGKENLLPVDKRKTMHIG